jgi:hypothetical protein
MSPLRRTSPRAGTLLPAATLLFASLVAAACGGGQGASDPSRQIAAANQRLLGTWMLVDFQPEVPLEPMLAQLLSMQMGHLTAQLDGGRIVATGMGVQATRTYRIDEASGMGDRFKMTLYDETGVSYDAWGDLQGDVIQFQSLTPPWQGSGTLKRVASQSGL